MGVTAQVIGRPRGTTKDTSSRSLNGPPILSEGAGREDRRRPDTCDSCKVPARSEPLLTFELHLAGKRAGEWTLCMRCWEWRNGRHLDPDPLHVDEDAA